MTPIDRAVLGYVGPMGDRNARPNRAVPDLLAAVAEATGRAPQPFGGTFAATAGSSADHLRAAWPHLVRYAAAVADQVTRGQTPVLVNGRCATSLATIPQVLAAHPDAVVVWLDAHADLNVPETSQSDYLGGMALSGPLGWWNSGLGDGLTADRLVLVGTRSIDPAEHAAIAEHRITVVAPHPNLAQQVGDVVAGRPVFFHLDCDVLNPDIVATDFAEPGGIDLSTLGELAFALAESSQVVAIELAEYEGAGSATAADLVASVRPLLDRAV